MVLVLVEIDEQPSLHPRSLNAGAIKHDRRRPGRTDADLALIPLLRGTTPLIEPLPVSPAVHENAGQACFDFRTKPGPAEQAHLDSLDDGGNPARGVMLGLLLLLPLWAVLAVICHWLLA